MVKEDPFQVLRLLLLAQLDLEMARMTKQIPCKKNNQVLHYSVLTLPSIV